MNYLKWRKVIYGINHDRWLFYSHDAIEIKNVNIIQIKPRKMKNTMQASTHFLPICYTPMYRIYYVAIQYFYKKAKRLHMAGHHYALMH
jgi:hypothetical protein